MSFIHSFAFILFILSLMHNSTESGVPDYRSPNGSYSKGHKPTTYQDFVNKPLTRQRYPIFVYLFLILFYYYYCIFINTSKIYFHIIILLF